jgi:hypothetical protein
MSRFGIRSIIVIFIILGTSAIAMASTPGLMSYQGILKDSEGNPVTTTTTIIMTIYDDATAGDPSNIKWQETHLITPDENGLFSAILGEGVVPIAITDDVFNGPDRWLGIQVAGEDEQSPRTRIVSNAFSQRVSTVDGATGGTISGDVSIASNLNVYGEAKCEVDGVDFFMVPRGAIIMWSGALDSIPAGWALCDGYNGTPDLTDKFICGVQTGEDPGATGGSATIPAHNHTVNPPALTTSSGGGWTIPDHAHVVDIPSFSTGGPSSVWYGANVGVSRVADYRHTHTVNPPSDSTTLDGEATIPDHTHTVDCPSVITSSDGDASNLPPYYRLAFIMKL